ncbi:MAG: CDP-diglyceride synthetase [bacterium P3]|nr:MAG: CDP-diglyceride synthetase [bacterium P3]KWW42663.1 MAG: CDP-diglyceride synthetase [bacterium F083]
MKKFWIRTASATVYAVLFVGSICCGRLLHNPTAGHLVLLAFLMFVAMGCTFEFYRMVRGQGSCPHVWLGYCYVAVTLLSLGMMSWPSPAGGLWRINWNGLLLLLIVAVLSFVVTAVRQLWSPSDQPFRDIAYTLLPVAYIALPLGLMPVLNNENMLLVVVVLVWVCDSFAYMGGSLFGRHTMWQRHSPGKTWEGTAFGVLCCVAAAILAGPLFNSTPRWYDWVVTGLVCGLLGTLGDLVESMLKRSVGVKDSGSVMPGHGGFLDRFDSLLVIVPVVCCYMLFIFD